MRSRLVLILALALAGCTQGPDAEPERALIVVRHNDSLPPAPRITVLPATPVLLGVTIAIDSLDVSWLTGWAKVTSADHSDSSNVAINVNRLSDTAWVPVRPGQQYNVTGWLVTSSVPTRSSPLTQVQSISTPAAPTEAPRAPGALTIVALSPYDVQLLWQDRSTNEYGFAIERAPAGSQTFERVGIVRGNTNRWVHAGFAPGETASYRVLSFNAAGVSPPTAARSVETSRDVSHAVSIEPPAHDTVSDCLPDSFDLTARARDEFAEQPRLMRAVPFGQQQADMVVYGCGNANCNVELYAQLGGCKRRIGELFFVAGDSLNPGWTVRAHDAAGWPIIETIGHGSASTYSVSTHQLRAGRYQMVSSYFVCGTVLDVARWKGDNDFGYQDVHTADLRRLLPPFRYCQFSRGEQN